MMPEKMASLGLVKIKVFWSKDYDVTNKNFPDLVMWPKFDNSGISVREFPTTWIFLRMWPEKPLFLRGGLGSSWINWD